MPLGEGREPLTFYREPQAQPVMEKPVACCNSPKMYAPSNVREQYPSKLTLAEFLDRW